MSQRTRKSISETMSTTPQRVTRRSLATTEQPEEVKTPSRGTRAPSVTSESARGKGKAEISTPQKATRKSIVKVDVADESSVRTPTRRTRTSSVSSVASDVSEICSESGRVTRRSSRLSGIKLEEISELPAELTGRKRTSSISSITSETPQPSKPGRRSSSGKDAESLENATPIAKNRLLDLGRHDDSPMTVSSTRKSRKLSLPTVDEDAMETSERQPVLSTKELEEITFSSDNDDEEDKDISSRKKTRKSILPARNDLNTIDEDETELGKPEAMDIEEDKEGTNASPRKSPRKVFQHIDSEVETKGSPKSPKKELLQKHIEDEKKTPEKTGEDKTPKKVTDGKKTPEKTLCLNKEMSPLVCVNKIDATDVSPSLVLDRVSNKSQSPVKSATPVQNKRKSKGQEESTVELTPSSDSNKMTRNSKGHDEIPMNKTPNDSNPRTRKSSDNETNDTPKDTRKKSLENKSNTPAESKRKSKGSEQESQLEGLNEKSSEIDSNAGEEIVSVGNRKRKSKEPIVEREETPKRKSMGKASRNSSMVEEDEEKPVSIEEITVDDDDTDEEVDIIEQDMATEKPSGKRKSRDTKDVSEGKQAQGQATPELKKRKSEANLVAEQVEDEGLNENKDDDETVDDNKIETKEETLEKLRLEKAKALLEKKRKMALKRRRRKLVLKKKLAQSNSNSEDGESKQQPKAVEQKGLDKSEKKKDVSTHNIALTDKSNNDLSAEEQERKRLERILDKNRDRKEKWVKRLAEMKAVAAERKKEEKLEKKAANKILFDAIRAAEGQTAPEKRIKNRRRKGKKDKLHVSNSDGANKSDTPNINLSDIVAKLEAMTQPKGDVAGVLKERNEDVDEVARGKAKSGRWWKETKDKFSTMVKTPGLRRPHSEKERLRADIKHNKEMTRHILETAARAKEEHRQRRAENIKRREENAKKAEIVQVIKNPAKLKRMKKKQLRLIEKRDTLPIVEKRNQSADV